MRAPGRERPQVSPGVGRDGQTGKVAREQGRRVLADHRLERLQDEEADQREAAHRHREADAQDAPGHRARHDGAEPGLPRDARAHRLQHSIERQVVEHRQQQGDHEAVGDVLGLLDHGQRGEHAKLQRADHVAGEREAEQQRADPRRIAQHVAITARGLDVRPPLRIESLRRQHEGAAHDRHFPEERQRGPRELQPIEVHGQHEVDGRRQPVPEGEPAPRQERGLRARREPVPPPPYDDGRRHVHELEPCEPAEEDRRRHRRDAGQREQRVRRRDQDAEERDGQRSSQGRERHGVIGERKRCATRMPVRRPAGSST